MGPEGIRTPRRISGKWIPPLFLLLLVLLAFYKIVTFQEFPAGNDIRDIFYPRKIFYAEQIKNFCLSLWTSYINNGLPLHSQSQTGIFYPINFLLYFFLPTHIAFNLSVVLHFFLAGIFTYLYARTIGLGELPSLVSSSIFVFNGFLIKQGQIDILFICAYLPLIFYFIERCFREKYRRRLIYSALAGLCIGIQFLIGHPQMVFYSLLASILYFFFKMLINIRELKNEKSITTFALAFVIMIAVVFGIGAIQIIPTMELIPLSERAEGVSAEYAGAISFSPKFLLTFIFPNFFQGQYRNTTIRDILGWPPEIGYIGILPLMLSLAAFLNRKNRYAIFFSFLALISLILALGKHTLLFPVIFGYVPGLRYFAYPVRFLYLFTFSVAILSGLGLMALTNDFGERQKLVRHTLILFIFLIFMAGVLAVTGFGRGIVQIFYDGFKSLNPAIWFSIILLTSSIVLMILQGKSKLRNFTFVSLCLFLIIVDLFIFGFNSINKSTIKMSETLSTPNTAKFLSKDKGVYSIFTLDEIGIEEKYARELLPTGFSMTYHLPSVGFGPSSLSIKRVDELLGYLYEPEESKVVHHLNLLSLMNVKYILSKYSLEDKRLKLIFDDKVKIYENKEVMPKVFIATDFRIIKDEKKILETLKSKSFNPREYIILEEGVDRDLKHFANSSRNPAISNYSQQNVVIEADMDCDGFLVLSDIYYPGWKVFIDGRKEKIYKTNYILRSVYLKKGRHRVEFIYDPASFRMGYIITFSTLLLIISVLIYCKVNKESEQENVGKKENC